MGVTVEQTLQKKTNKQTTCEPKDITTGAIQNEIQKERIKKINRKGENQNPKSRVSVCYRMISSGLITHVSGVPGEEGRGTVNISRKMNKFYKSDEKYKPKDP